MWQLKICQSFKSRICDWKRSCSSNVSSELFSALVFSKDVPLSLRPSSSLDVYCFVLVYLPPSRVMVSMNSGIFTRFTSFLSKTLQAACHKKISRKEMLKGLTPLKFVAHQLKNQPLEKEIQFWKSSFSGSMLELGCCNAALTFCQAPTAANNSQQNTCIYAVLIAHQSIFDLRFFSCEEQMRDPGILLKSTSAT